MKILPDFSSICRTIKICAHGTSVLTTPNRDSRRNDFTNN